MEPTQWTMIRQAKLSTIQAAVLPPSVKLPILPEAITEFLEQAARPDANPKELAKIVESDAGLTCELLRVVNSAATGLRCHVVSVIQAMNLLGLRNTTLLLSTTAVKSAMPLRKSKLINLQMFWNTNYERALFARDVAQMMGTDKELAFAGSLLQDFLLPLLTSELVDSYVSFADRARQESLSLVTFEQQNWGWDHALAAGQILASWKLPDELACCTLYHHAGLDILSNQDLAKTAVSAVAIAGLLPDFFQQVPDGWDRLMKLDTAWPAFRLAERLERVADKFQEAKLADSAQHVTFRKRYEKKLAGACERHPSLLPASKS